MFSIVFKYRRLEKEKTGGFPMSGSAVVEVGAAVCYILALIMIIVSILRKACGGDGTIPFRIAVLAVIMCFFMVAVYFQAELDTLKELLGTAIPK